jgi:hypothetical protein
MRAAWLLAPLAVLLALAVAPVAARADGDPASDVLLTQRQYLPYKPPMSKAAADKLAQATLAIQKTGKPVRVALINSPADLGAVPDFFGRPEEYAKFLSKELELGYHGGLLVVMPAGTGTAKLPAAAASSLRGLQISTGATSDDLADAAIVALQRIAKAQGAPIPTIVAESSSGGVHWTEAIVAVVLAALLAAAIAAATYRVRRRRGAAPAPA